MSNYESNTYLLEFFFKMTFSDCPNEMSNMLLKNWLSKDKKLFIYLSIFTFKSHAHLM